MIKKTTLILGLGLILLSGCGSSSNSDDSNTSGASNGETTLNLKNPSTVEEMQKSIVGTWVTPCTKEDEGRWYNSIDIYTDKNAVTHKGNSYSESDCKESSLIESNGGSGTYTIGNKTKDSENRDAFKFDIIGSGFAMYKVASIINDKLYTSHKSDTLDESNEESRSNEISMDEGGIRQ